MIELIQTDSERVVILCQSDSYILSTKWKYHRFILLRIITTKQNYRLINVIIWSDYTDDSSSSQNHISVIVSKLRVNIRFLYDDVTQKTWSSIERKHVVLFIYISKCVASDAREGDEIICYNNNIRTERIRIVLTNRHPSLN